MLKTTILFVTVLLTVLNVSSQTTSTRRLAWDLGDDISLAALGNAEGAPKRNVDSLLAKAKVNGKRFGVVIPDLPVNTASKAKNRAEALFYLLRKVGNPMVGILKRDFDEEHALLFEVSLKSNILLLLYGPGGSETETIADVIKTRSARIGLPAHLTADLLKLIAARADYPKVKASIFKMHADVGRHLAGTK